MLDRKGEDWRAVVVADTALDGVEAYALAYEGLLGAALAPDGEGHLEADREGAAAVTGAGSLGVLAMQLVSGDGAFDVRWDVTSHVEALHLE